ncbi:MAG: Ig-like domain-containing protein, partial [Verrucomicrobiota bacterium]
WLAGAATPPYAFAWSNVTAGTYSLRAVAIDNLGLATTSSVANIAVSPFLVTLTSPAPNAFFSEPATIALAAMITGNGNPIRQMDFYAGSNRIVSITSPPYTYTWAGVSQGIYALRAAALDVTGLSSTSSVVTVTVGTPVTVTLIEPTNQSNFAVAETLNLKATASSSNGPIRIEFFDGTNKLGESASNPGVLAWQVTTAGTHSLTAKLTDGFGQVATSPPVLIQVTDADSDYDGRSNAQELADGTDPFSASSVRPVLLGSWAFDTSAFLGDQGQVPLYKNGALLVPSWNSNAVAIGMGAGIGLTYRDVETNFQANINCRNGTVRFWFKPNWNSSANGITGGPRTDARLIELGGYGLPEGWWALGMNADGISLYFGTMTNLEYTSYLAHPINWKSNRWYQLTLTYTTNNTLLYLNGELVAAGRGVQCWPSARIRAYGFRVGLDWYGGQSPNGQFENLETFNYPLDSQTVAHEFPNHQLPAGIIDSDYDGRSDFLEMQVDKTDPNNSNDAVPVRLGYWRFDSADWHGELGQLPLATNGVVASSSWSGTAANISQAGGSGLIYRDQETNGWANINCRNGSVLFWFKPNWNSALNGGLGGTGTAARLLEIGDPNSSEGWWGLWVNSNATQLAFSTMSKLAPTTVLSAPIHWNSNQWYQLALTYSPTNSALYLNGTLAASGLGVPSFPSASQRANGFRIGAGVQPGQSANGHFDELQTFNYPVATSLIAAEVGNVEAIDSN